MVKLSGRLAAVADIVPAGCAFVDVGTDHSYLPIALIQSGKIHRAVATDIGDGPLENAMNSINENNVSGISLRKCDGLSGVLEPEADCIAITGMGGELISDIIDKADWLRSFDKLLILQPMSSAEELREYLCLHGFSIICEEIVKDSDRLYTVMSVRYSGEVIQPDTSFCYIGKSAESGGENALAYIKHQWNRLVKKADSIKTVARKEAEYKNLLPVIDQIGKIISHM